MINSDMRFINRTTDGKGWSVSATRTKKYRKRFGDDIHGGVGVALVEAKNYRDSIQDEIEKESKGCKAYVVKGSTPCSMDLFRYRVYLKDPKIGDELVFLNAGAYNFTTDFCDLEKLKMELVE